MNDSTDGSQPVHGPDAFQADGNGSFTRTGATALACGHTFSATAFVGGQVAATSAPATPACAPVRVATVTLQVPDAPGQGFTVRGDGFDAWAWVWVDVNDSTDGSQPVHGPDAFQADGNGSFTRTGATALACGHTFSATAFVGGQVAAVSAPTAPGCAAAAPATADASASAAVQALYSDLVAAPGRADHRVVVGQALRGWDFARPVAEPVTSLTEAGYPAPKLVELDVTAFGVTQAHDDELYALLADHVARGGLVGVSYHAPSPFTGGSVYDRDGVALAELADPSQPWSDAGWRWQAELDRAADVLSRLQDAGAVVLFRPFHESNGSWFWWGQADPAEFRALWAGAFRYLSGTKGLHNLLWVYSANRSLGGPLYDPTRLFPGADAVDVVGLDVYDDDLSDAAAGEPGYDAMVALGKPFALTEYGAAMGHDGAAVLPNAKVVETLRAKYPAAVLASSWYSQDGDNWQISDRPDPGALLFDSWAVTR